MKNRREKTSLSDRFYDRYKRAERFYLKPATAEGKPGLIEAVAPDGDTVLVREWPRRSTSDDDLVEIWKHELRQLHRLGGYPGAQNYIARLVDADKDEKGFYIALDVGQRRPLEVLLERGRGAADWLRSLGLPANRHRLWKNLKRIALGLEILHNEGLIHRNLDGWSILTGAGDDPDFQLTGFEWSLRLSGTSDQRGRGRAPDPPVVSFAADWAAFARVAARLLNIAEARLVDRQISAYEVHDSAPAPEVRLLRELLTPEHAFRRDGELVSSRIDQLLEALNAAKASEDGRYHLAVRLGVNSALSTAVREATSLEIEMDDIESQLAWIDSDLGATLHLIGVGKGEDGQLFLRGRDLVYRLKKHSVGNGEPASWQFAFCESAEATTRWQRNVAGSTELPSSSLRLLSHVEARQSWGRLRGRTPSWARQLETMTTDAAAAPTPETRIHRALTLLHTLQIAFAAADAHRMRVIRSGADDAVELQYVATQETEEIAKALGLDPPLARLRESLDVETAGEGEGWVLSESARLGQAQAGDMELTFDAVLPTDDGARFRFRTISLAPMLIEHGYLVPAGSRGDFAQFRRRSKALRLLRGHSELLQVLADPRRQIMSAHDEVAEDEGYRALDIAKQTALKELTSVLPLYMLQGPPGVGKTYLVKDVVQRRFKEDHSSRLLVSAQGNQPVDHLLDELSEKWLASPETAPLAVRCRPKDEKDLDGEFDLGPTTERLAAGLAGTPLAEAASPALQAKLQALAGRGASGANASVAGERRSLEGLLMRSANIVFATANSAHLERLVDERGQFDWAIIEEAGKATGAELISPLMLSHRRLMIGDHKQLPPFGSRELEELLDKEDAVRATLKTLSRIIDPAIRNLLDEELLEFIEDEAQDLVPLCTEAKRVLYLFETMLTAELERRERRPSARPIGSTLKVQHRMHPVICSLVSKTFYGGLLTTSVAREQDALAEMGDIWSTDERALPNTPVAVIDMPYERSAIHRGRIESLPRFSNSSEVDAIVNVASKLSVRPGLAKAPSLVVLAPYARQVRKLKDALMADATSSDALKAFRPAARGGEWCSTVDAFQGNEADVVIFSLVRNNRGATIKHALGFVGDKRRFNVLLSRARRRLVFVGSLEFLRTVASPLGMPSDPDSAFLRQFLLQLDIQVAAGEVGLCAAKAEVPA